MHENRAVRGEGMKYFLGVDIGGTKTAAGLLDADRHMLAEKEIPTFVHDGAEGIARNTAELIFTLLEQEGIKKSQIPYLGVGCPGTVNQKTGVVEYANNLYFEHVPLGDMLTREVGLPVFLENDANCAGLGEYWALPDREEVESLFMVTLGTGVGTAFIWKGELFTGFNGAAPEMGHCTLNAEGELCDCKNRGCWEVYCAGHALVRAGREAAKNYPESLLRELSGQDLERIDGNLIFHAWRQGDEAAGKVVERYLYYYKAGIGNVINAFQPQVLTIGGGISRQGTLFLEAAREAIAELSYCKTTARTQVRRAVLGTKAGIYGAAWLGAKG